MSALITNPLLEHLQSLASQGSVIAQEMIESFNTDRITLPEMDGLWFLDERDDFQIKWIGGGKSAQYKPDGLYFNWKRIGFLTKDYSCKDIDEFTRLFNPLAPVRHEFVSGNDFDGLYRVFHTDNCKRLSSDYESSNYDPERYALMMANFLKECTRNTRVLVIYNAQDKVLGRALIWDEVVVVGEKGYYASLLDWVNARTENLVQYIRDKAREDGVMLYALSGGAVQSLISNDAKIREIEDDCLPYPVNVKVTIHVKDDYDWGFPYHSYLRYFGLHWPVYAGMSEPCELAMNCTKNTVATVVAGNKLSYWTLPCPKCGSSFSTSSSDVDQEHECGFKFPVTQTPFGPVLETETRMYDGYMLPDFLFDEKGELLENAMTFLKFSKLSASRTK